MKSLARDGDSDPVTAGAAPGGSAAGVAGVAQIHAQHPVARAPQELRRIEDRLVRPAARAAEDARVQHYGRDASARRIFGSGLKQT